MADKQIDKYLPKLRFPEFKDDGEWKVKNLCEIAEKRVERNQGNLPLPVLTNSATEGVLNQAYYFERDIVSKDNLGNYYIVDKDDFVYNPRISSNAPVGPISRNKVGRGIMSPLYTVFRFRKGNLDFFEQFFKTICWHQYIRKKANFGARFDRINITADDFFNLPVPFPSDSEQTQIATALCSLDSLIQACQEKLEQLKAHKEGLMQKLFPATERTLPEIRFAEGKWGTSILDDMIEIITPPKRLLSTDYGQSGLYPIVDQSKEYICGFSNDSDAVFNKTSEDVIVFGDHTCNLKFVNFPFIQGADGIKVFKSKFPEIVSTRFLFHYLSFIPIPQCQYKRHFSELKEKSIRYPNTLLEQTYISATLSSLDECISTSKEKLVKLKAHKKGLMQQIFSIL